MANLLTEPISAHDVLGTLGDFTKLLVTLATSVVGGGVILLREIQVLSKNAKLLLAFSWGFMAVSLLSGVFTMMAISGSAVEAYEKKTVTFDNIKVPSFIQIVSFGAGGVLLAVSVWSAVKEKPKIVSPDDASVIAAGD